MQTKPVIDQQPLSIPIKDIGLFIDELSKAQFSEGEYQPSITWTDDYPHLEINIELRTGMLSFYSDSQGEQHVPWGMSYDHRTYTLGAAPMDALDILLPYLKKDRLKALEDQVVEAMNEPTPTPTP